jgi:hypothetical protein
VDGLDEDEHLVVTVTSNAPTTGSHAALVGVDVYPDADGKATLDSETLGAVHSTQVTASIWVLGKDEIAGATTPPPGDADFKLAASYPKVPAPKSAKASK